MAKASLIRPTLFRKRLYQHPDLRILKRKTHPNFHSVLDCSVSNILNYEKRLQVPVIIVIPFDWTNTPPLVLCYESWITRDIDWHAGESRWLCWVYAGEWVFEIERNVSWYDRWIAAEYAVAFLVKNLRYLLSCHRLGFELGYSHWQEDWTQFAHGEGAYEDFEILKKQYDIDER